MQLSLNQSREEFLVTLDYMEDHEQSTELGRLIIDNLVTMEANVFDINYQYMENPTKGDGYSNDHGDGWGYDSGIIDGDGYGCGREYGYGGIDGDGFGNGNGYNRD